MSRAGFYSDNSLRNYPFIGGTSGIALSTKVIVDFGCIVGPAAQFQTGVHKVWLYQVTKDEDTFRFEFKSDAPGLAGRSLVFEFNVDDPEYTTRFAFDDIALGSIGSASSSTDTCNADTAWEGYLVIGQLLRVIDSFEGIPPGVILWDDAKGLLWKNVAFILEQIVPVDFGNTPADVDGSGSTTIEPTLIQNLNDIYVRQISLANTPRTKATPPTVCDSSSSRTPEPNYVNYECIKGDVKLLAGYNCEINVSTGDNSITIGGFIGGGVGQPCDEPLLYSSEIPPEGSNLLSGGPECKDVLKTINGISGKTISIVGGLGVTISDGPGPATITINPDHHGMALCSGFTTSSVGG